jgi:hypothetical protein
MRIQRLEQRGEEVGQDLAGIAGSSDATGFTRFHGM